MSKIIEAAASARLCVETAGKKSRLAHVPQPPPRGCVLKRRKCQI